MKKAFCDFCNKSVNYHIDHNNFPVCDTCGCKVRFEEDARSDSLNAESTLCVHSSPELTHKANTPPLDREKAKARGRKLFLILFMVYGLPFVITLVVLSILFLSGDFQEDTKRMASGITEETTLSDNLLGTDSSTKQADLDSLADHPLTLTEQLQSMLADTGYLYYKRELNDDRLSIVESEGEIYFCFSWGDNFLLADCIGDEIYLSPLVAGEETETFPLTLDLSQPGHLILDRETYTLVEDVESDNYAAYLKMQYPLYNEIWTFPDDYINSLQEYFIERDLLAFLGLYETTYRELTLTVPEEIEIDCSKGDGIDYIAGTVCDTLKSAIDDEYYTFAGITDFREREIDILITVNMRDNDGYSYFFESSEIDTSLEDKYDEIGYAWDNALSEY